MENLDPKDPVALTRALIQCESVTPDEGGALTLLEGILESAGFTCHRLTFQEPGTPDVENLYARLGTGGPNLCFAGHTDVVPPGDLTAWSVPPFSGIIRDGELFGRGAVDMKGGIACFVAAVLAWLDSRAHDSALPGSVSLLITGDEEGPSINGTAKVLDWLLERGERLDACVVGEPTNPHALGDEIKIGRRGSLNGEIIVSGHQGHAAYPDKADNPVPVLARIIDRLSNEPLDQGSEHFQPSNLEVTIVSVPNTVTNVIPGRARASFNVRYNDLWTRERLEAWVRDICAKTSDGLGGEGISDRVSVSFSGTGTVFLTTRGPLVDTMVEAVTAVSGRVPKLTTGGGTSDARFIKDACPVIEFGLVNEMIHKVDECVAVEDLNALREIYQTFVERYFARRS